LLFPAETYMTCVINFYVLGGKLSIGSNKKVQNFPIDLHCKHLTFGNVMYGKILCLLSDPAEISDYIKGQLSVNDIAPL